jgi:hypothetical protein
MTLTAWTAAALPVLEQVVRIYHATVTYKEGGDQVHEAAGLHACVLLLNGIGQVLVGTPSE